MFRPNAVGGDFSVVQIDNGGDDQSNPGVEVKSDKDPPPA